MTRAGETTMEAVEEISPRVREALEAAQKALARLVFPADDDTDTLGAYAQCREAEAKVRRIIQAEQSS